ncbi:MAG: hypothetical protein GKS04_02040 [Candidatus Mycalebacterium zealandia]|nr:MAG: hypothetical protein GKS04_02040 [Candidatus Mycalebacterium zealandia]
MKLKKTILTAVVITTVAFGQANAGHDEDHSHKHSEEARIEEPDSPISSEEIIHIKVTGLVCDFCARSIQKVFLKTGAIEEAYVNLKHKSVTLYVKKGKNLSDKQVRKFLEDSGYASAKISRYKKGGKR